MSDRTPQPLTDEQLAEIQARAEAATRGPWWTDRLPELDGSETFAIDAHGDSWIVPLEDVCEADAEFMAHARTDVPLLLDEVQRLKGELAKVAEFVAKRAEYITAINNCHENNEHDYWRWQGHAESRRQLAQELGLPVAWPAEYQEASS